MNPELNDFYPRVPFLNCAPIKKKNAKDSSHEPWASTPAQPPNAPRCLEELPFLCISRVAAVSPRVRLSELVKGQVRLAEK